MANVINLDSHPQKLSRQARAALFDEMASISEAVAKSTLNSGQLKVMLAVLNETHLKGFPRKKLTPREVGLAAGIHSQEAAAIVKLLLGAKLLVKDDDGIGCNPKTRAWDMLEVHNPADDGLKRWRKATYRDRIKWAYGQFNKNSGKQHEPFKPDGSLSGPAQVVADRIREGYTHRDIAMVLQYKWEQLQKDDFYKKYYRVSTLFCASRFPEYLNEAKDYFKESEKHG